MTRLLVSVLESDNINENRDGNAISKDDNGLWIEAESQAGAAGRELQRLLPPTYRDGLGLPRGARGLPGARKVSASLHHESGDPKTNVLKADTTPDRSHTHFLMEFGHFLAHDISLTSQAELDCCSPEVLALESELPDSLKRCFNIDVSRDRFYSSAGRSCHSFTRSDARCLASGSNVREQFNSVTGKPLQRKAQAAKYKNFHLSKAVQQRDW